MNELIWQRLVAIQREVEAIIKTKKEGSEIKYKFRGIDDMYNHIHPLHKKHGVIIIPRVLDAIREERKSASGKTLIYTILDIEYDFVAEDGTKATARTRGEAMDSGDKATNKAMSVALKYALMHMYLIPTEDILSNDPDMSAQVIDEVMSPDELAILKEALEMCESKEEVLSLWKSEYLKDERIKSYFDIRRNELKADGQWPEEVK